MKQATGYRLHYQDPRLCTHIKNPKRGTKDHMTTTTGYVENSAKLMNQQEQSAKSVTCRVTFQDKESMLQISQNHYKGQKLIHFRIHPIHHISSKNPESRVLLCLRNVYFGSNSQHFLLSLSPVVYPNNYLARIKWADNTCDMPKMALVLKEPRP